MTNKVVEQNNKKAAAFIGHTMRREGLEFVTIKENSKDKEAELRHTKQHIVLLRGRGAVAQSIERAIPGEEVLGLIPAGAPPPPPPFPTGWVGVSIMWPAKTGVMVSPLCLVFGST